MKLLFLFCVCITLSAALPQQRRIYKNYLPRKQLRQADGAVNVTTTTTTTTTTVAPVPVVTTAAESDEDATEAPVVQEVVSGNATTTVEPEAENKPIAEPTKAPAQAVPAQPAAVTASPAAAVNQTFPEEEDDSSSEEEADDAKQLPIVRLEAPRRQNNKKSRDTKDVKPNFGGIVRGYVSESGEVLVPISAFPGNFHFSIVHDDKVEVNAEDAVPASSSEEVVANVEDVETESNEEVVAVKKGAPANETEPSSASEEAKPDSSSSVEEAEEKVVSSESTEKPSGEPVPVKETPTSIFNPPPLAALPATKPTDEDDEEEAGGRFLPPGPPGYYIPYNFNPYHYDDYEF